MKKLLILCCAVLTLCMAHAQWPNVSTGIDNISGAALSNYTLDPNWHLGTPSPIPTSATYVQPYLSGFWNPTPVGGTPPTNAGWINPSTSPGNDVPGVYWFERNFTINPGTGTFSTNFKIACDDDLVSLQLIPPGAGTPINLPVVFNTNHNPPQYYLSKLIIKKITCPKLGMWTIRAKINYVDNIGGFLLSGRIDTTVTGCNTCSCDTTCKLSVTVGGLSGSPFSCGKTINLKCDNNYNFKPSLTCKGTGCTTSVTSVMLTDASNNTPVWANTFIANNGAGSLSIPPGIPAGIYTLTYTYGVNGKKCGTCKFKLNIACKCNCNFSLGYEGYQTVDTVSCGDTVKAVCHTNTLYSPILKCTDSTTQFIGFSLTDANGNVPSWAANFNGTGALLVPANISGIFTLNYIWGSPNGIACDSCKVYLSVLCCPPIPCTLTATIKTKTSTTQTLHCGDTTLRSCGVLYSIVPTLNCNGDTTSHITSATLVDGNGNTPSWASTFLSNNGIGSLSVPSGVSGYYTLTYYWGFAGLTCGSCRFVLKIQCCTNFSVNAGPDLITCCSSNGVQLNATPSGGVAPYTYSWSPTTNLFNPNTANPIAHAIGTYVVTVTDAFGCIATDTVKVIFSGVSCCRIAGNKTKAQVYPNPFKDGFILKLPANSVAEVQVTNMQGRPEEIKTKASGSVQMGNTLKYGVYTIVVKYNDGTKEEIKVIKNQK